MNESVRSRVWRIAEPLAASERMEIVDIDYRRESGGMILRLFLGGQDDAPVGLEELSRVSRQLGDLLDVHEIVPGAYTLEVSSPGINRRLRLPEHFRRFIGKKVKVRCVTPIIGRRTFTGILQDVGADGVRVSDGEGEHFIPFADIAQANYQAEL